MAVDKLVDSSQLDTDLTAVANAIRTKGGTSASLAFPAGFVDAIDAIETGGGDVSEVLDDFLEKTSDFSDIVLPQATSIQAYMFANHTELHTLSAPNVTTIGTSAFDGAKYLTTINLPKLTKGSTYGFRYVNSLTEAYFPSMTTVGDSLFYQVRSSAPPAILTVVLPAVTGTVTGKAFRQSWLVAVDIGPGATGIGSDCFYAGSYGKVILRNPNAVVTAASRDSVKSIKTLYVPQALVESYATATNWATDAASRTVLPIEGSIYETQYANGVPIT